MTRVSVMGVAAARAWLCASDSVKPSFILCPGARGVAWREAAEDLTRVGQQCQAFRRSRLMWAGGAIGGRDDAPES